VKAKTQNIYEQATPQRGKGEKMKGFTQIVKHRRMRRPKFKLDEVVRVLRAPKGQNQWVLTGAECRVPCVGDTGTVIEVYSDPREAYCVEAVASDGRTGWLLDFLPGDLQSV
jgi:hypothetical protein